MKPQSRLILALVLLLTGGVLLSGCGSSPSKKAALQGDNTRAVNFSGSWEMDYSQSDNTQEKLDSIIREMNRQAERRAKGNMRQGSGSGIVIDAAGTNSGSSIIGLVRLTDLITQAPLLEITQDDEQIRVKREQEFDLTCEFHPGKTHAVETPFGTEICGWNGHQLVFGLKLPDGLSMQHVMTMGAAGQKLNVATTVTSSQVSFPFTLNRVFNRFEPGDDGIRCEMTLTRGRVCTTESR